MNISKKSAIILILGAVILLIGLFLYFYLSPTKTNTTNTVATSTKNVSFGDTSKTNNEIPTDTTKTGTTTQVSSNRPAETLRQIFSEPTSGSIVYTKNKDTVARFVERSNGNVYEVKRNSSETIRLTNTTIPKIQEAIWDKGGNDILFRYLNESRGDQIETFAGKIKLSTSTSNEFFGEILGTFLPAKLLQVTTNPSSGKIAYIQNKINNDGTYIYISNTNGSNKVQLADIPLSEVSISWPKENTIALITKPSSRYAGFLYFINTQEGVLRKVIGDVWGLNALVNSQANKVVYSKTSRNEPVINFYDMTTGEDTSLQIKTLADKCVWGKKDTEVIFCAVPNTIPAGDYPDSWYQGKTFFNDNIWKINLETGQSTMIRDIASDGLSIDAMSLAISDKDDFLVFTNKKDLSLWGLIIE
jgi:hypothetical protein